jgi:hypothetical protein
MELLIENARTLLDDMKKTAKQIKEIDEKLEKSNSYDHDLSGEQFRLSIDIIKLYEKMENILVALECDEQTMFIARRFRIQADELVGKKREYDFK